VAKKSKAGAAAPGKVSKVKSSGRSTSSKTKRPARPKRPPAEKPKPEAAPALFDPTDNQIQTRAYFISERRRRFDLSGDANSDWLEAKRQLLSETRR